MRLNNIKIKNFRCFEKVSIDFDKHITLIVGKTEPERQHYWMLWLFQSVHFC